jgi:hypothetical protein
MATASGAYGILGRYKNALTPGCVVVCGSERGEAGQVNSGAAFAAGRLGGILWRR